MRYIYDRLMSGPGGGDPFDRHLFACAVAIALGDDSRPLAAGLGLSPQSLAALVGRFFPRASFLLTGLTGGAGIEGALAMAPEEPDLRALLLDHRTSFLVEEEWLAHIVARRSLGTNHLWQDLGLPHRGDLGRLLHRHFAPLATRNVNDMKWKKFFYRELCQREGIFICKSPSCDSCTDFRQCFGAEDGLSLLATLHPDTKKIAPLLT
jgi:nitrogen fixation protein NifQ